MAPPFCAFALLIPKPIQALHGFMFGVDATKSIILTLACMERRLTVRDMMADDEYHHYEKYDVNIMGNMMWIF